MCKYFHLKDELQKPEGHSKRAAPTYFALVPTQ